MQDSDPIAIFLLSHAHMHTCTYHFLSVSHDHSRSGRFLCNWTSLVILVALTPTVALCRRAHICASNTCAQSTCAAMHVMSIQISPHYLNRSKKFVPCCFCLFESHFDLCLPQLLPSLCSHTLIPGRSGGAKECPPEPLESLLEFHGQGPVDLEFHQQSLVASELLLRCNYGTPSALSSSLLHSRISNTKTARHRTPCEGTVCFRSG